jgi:hypothetical protein
MLLFTLKGYNIWQDEEGLFGITTEEVSICPYCGYYKLSSLLLLKGL